jgi:hypothetical protein
MDSTHTNKNTHTQTTHKPQQPHHTQPPHTKLTPTPTLSSDNVQYRRKHSEQNIHKITPFRTPTRPPETPYPYTLFSDPDRCSTDRICARTSNLEPRTSNSRGVASPLSSRRRREPLLEL